MAQDKTGEYPTPEVPRCYSWSHAKLQGAHAQYKDEGGHLQQSTKKVVQFEMGSKRKYHKNNRIGIMLFCGWVCSTSLGDIISCPETEPRAKQCMQSRHRMPETNQCRRPVLADWNCATRHPERCMCSSGKDQTGKPMRLTLYMVRTRQREGYSRGTVSCVVWSLLTSLLRWFDAVHGLGDHKQYPHRATVNIDESLANGFDRPWTTWRCLNRLRTGFTCSKEQRRRYYDGDTTCECGLATENTVHMMQCTLLEQPCSLDDFNKWKTLVWWHEEEQVCYVWTEKFVNWV